MVPLAKLAFNSGTKVNTFKMIIHLVFHHLLHMLIEKSHNSALLVPIKFLKSHFVPYMCPILIVFKNHMKQNGR